MSDQEYEKFEITDYDLDNEFNTNRPGRRQTKHQQIYGIWADEEDSGDESSLRPSFKSTKKPKSYSTPIGFVAGGVHQPGKNKTESKDKNEDDDNDDDIDTNFRRLKPGSSSSDEEERVSFTRAPSERGATNVDGDIAGLRKKRYQRTTLISERGVGAWEKHTKGIGAKLLLQMGFQPGKGLGKDLQGIHAPIEAQLRKGRGAIGAYGPEKGQKIADTKPDAKDEPSKTGSEKVSQWRKGDGSKKKKVRYVYKSIEDVLDQSLQPGKKPEISELSKVKVIDMTGPEQRVLSGYHAISGVKRPTDQWEIRKEKQFSNFAMPELQHNLNLLVDMCEQNIIANDRKMRYNEDRIVALEADISTLEKVTQQEAATIKGLEHVLSVIERLSQGSVTGSITLEEMADAYQDLQENYFSEYCVYELPGLAPGLVRPLLKTELSTWDPLREPNKPVPLFSKWKTILETDHTLTTATLQDPYHRLLWDAWMPCIRIAVNAWTCKTSEPMIELLNLWDPLIPRWILDNILQQLVLPRLQHDVEEWNPLTDTIPIHTWTHPWLPLLGKRLHLSVFPVIRQKLSVALTGWHPSDSSARLLLLPWVGVFTKPEFDTFLISNIVPKLNQVLQEFLINPHQQMLDNWNWVMEWTGMLPESVMADLLNKAFFPKWLQVLTMWLNINPNYDQVTKWYSGWKELIPETMRSHPSVSENFRTALDMMSRSVGGPVSQPPPPPPEAPGGRFQVNEAI
ncbi:hypothetical protein AAG570_012277 [Ranatra chinensis]|uniref:G-patch domain-containing protein n=1 Tax=Ranatra chinensis TaxID=642074 RepID=A0ABD0YIB7_9HEMI